MKKISRIKMFSILKKISEKKMYVFSILLVSGLSILFINFDFSKTPAVQSAIQAYRNNSDLAINGVRLNFKFVDFQKVGLAADAAATYSLYLPDSTGTKLILSNTVFINTGKAVTPDGQTVEANMSVLQTLGNMLHEANGHASWIADKFNGPDLMLSSDGLSANYPSFKMSELKSFYLQAEFYMQSMNNAVSVGNTKMSAEARYLMMQALGHLAQLSSAFEKIDPNIIISQGGNILVASKYLNKGQGDTRNRKFEAALESYNAAVRSGKLSMDNVNIEPEVVVAKVDGELETIQVSELAPEDYSNVKTEVASAANLYQLPVELEGVDAVTPEVVAPIGDTFNLDTIGGDYYFGEF